MTNSPELKRFWERNEVTDPCHNVTKQMANLFEAYLEEQAHRRNLQDRIEYLEGQIERLNRRLEQRDKEAG